MQSFVAALGLAGFFAGLMIYLFLFGVVIQRREKGKLENALLALLASLLVWYAGNFVSLLLRQMDLSKVAAALGVVDAFSFTGLALLPALLFHTHWRYYQRHRSPLSWERKAARASLLVLYLPLLLLPAALARLFPASAVNPIQKLGFFSGPFLGLLALAYYGSCLVGVRIVQTSNNPVERALFQKLAVFFAAIPLFNFYVFLWGGSEAGVAGQFLTIAALLSSLFPTLLVAYYIYRYRFLEIVLHRGVPMVLLILASLSFYLLGIRRLAGYLQEQLAAPPLLVEGLFLAALLLLFPALSRWLETHMGRLFSGEMRKYRQLAEAIQQGSSGKVHPDMLREFIEDTLRRELGAAAVRIHLDAESGPPPGETAYPLETGERRLGYLLIDLPETDFTTARQEALRLVANEIALSLERSRLLETTLTMERELAQRSHMEELGRMAAAVAHNVKNPLSSMKTLMQLLGESENLDSEQRTEVAMMIKEVDRLSKTITTLLKFSRLENRPDSSGEFSEVHLQNLLDSVESIFQGDLQARGLSLKKTVALTPPTIRSDADALTDILANLVSNAVEASPPGGKISIAIRPMDGEIVISVEDEGPGVEAGLRDRIFEPFVTTKARGTGLGLAIVRKRTEQLEGTIDLASPARSRGARFVVRLPIEGAEVSDAGSLQKPKSHPDSRTRGPRSK